jgi:hypothetical protein
MCWHGGSRYIPVVLSKLHWFWAPTYFDLPICRPYLLVWPGSKEVISNEWCLCWVFSVNHLSPSLNLQLQNDIWPCFHHRLVHMLGEVYVRVLQITSSKTLSIILVHLSWTRLVFTCASYQGAFFEGEIDASSGEAFHCYLNSGNWRAISRARVSVLFCLCWQHHQLLAK